MGLGGNDALFGLGGDDTLEGGAGDDLLVGGPGADTLMGGPNSEDTHILQCFTGRRYHKPDRRYGPGRRRRRRYDR